MNVRSIDPRDIESEMQAVYRVYFWGENWTLSEEFELTDAAGVREVLNGSTRTPTVAKSKP